MSINPSRRDFLKSLAASAVASTALVARSHSASADDKAGAAAGVDFGFSLYGMKEAKLNRALKLCADTGYDCVELVAIADWPCDPAKLAPTARGDLRKRLEDLKLTVPAIMEDLTVYA